MTYSSTSENIISNTGRGTRGAPGGPDLFLGVGKAERRQLADELAVLGEAGVDFDQHRLQARVAQRRPASRDHLVLETVDVDLDVRGRRDDAGRDELVERHRNASLD